MNAIDVLHVLLTYALHQVPACGKRWWRQEEVYVIGHQTICVYGAPRIARIL
jgi:hypothetical protein